MDTEGSEVHISDLPAPVKAEAGAEFTFTVRDAACATDNCFAVRWGARSNCVNPSSCPSVNGCPLLALFTAIQSTPTGPPTFPCPPTSPLPSHLPPALPPAARSYDGFAEDAQRGDMLVVDGGMVSLEVVSKAGPDVVARVVDPGLILSRANLVLRRAGRTVRARNAHLPVISAKARWRAELWLRMLGSCVPPAPGCLPASLSACVPACPPLAFICL